MRRRGGRKEGVRGILWVLGLLSAGLEMGWVVGIGTVGRGDLVYFVSISAWLKLHSRTWLWSFT